MTCPVVPLDRCEQIARLMPLAKAIAVTISRRIRGSDVEDLTSDAYVGLIRAVDNFDPTRGVALTSYAAIIIRGVVLNGVRSRDQVSERCRRVIRQAENDRYQLAVEGGELPSEAALHARWPQLAAAQKQVAICPLSLDSPITATLLREKGRPGTRGSHRGADPQTASAEHRALADLERKTIIDLLTQLTPGQKRVIYAFYFQALNLREAAELLGLSPQRCSQLHLAALRKLRVLGRRALRKAA
jgi:RNA polymerase sigma factor for flagellar operon FliA